MAHSTFWVDDSNPDRIAEPEEAYWEAREAHAWATQELATAADPWRIFNLTQERKRMADIAWRLKRRM
jgi:hypothetical protein